jgi:hypothetical protein
MWEIKPTFVTFVIPSKGRLSLEKSIQSLKEQTSPNWRAIIMFDGIVPINFDFNYQEDNHFIVGTCEKKDHAGLVRNKAFSFIDTKWTAFLDDDDFLKETYVEQLMKYEREYPDIDIIIFTYKDIENGNTRPAKNINHMACCEVGISFAIKTEFIKEKGIMFKPGGLEDWGFLNDCVNAGATYLITHDIQYYVGRRSSWQ